MDIINLPPLIFSQYSPLIPNMFNTQYFHVKSTAQKKLALTSSLLRLHNV